MNNPFFNGFGDELLKIAANMRLGSGGRFARLTKELAAKHGVGAQATKPVSKKQFKSGPTDWWKKAAVRDPAALAAAIGRKKYGKRRFQAMSAAGRKAKKK